MCLALGSGGGRRRGGGELGPHTEDQQDRGVEESELDTGAGRGRGSEVGGPAPAAPSASVRFSDLFSLAEEYEDSSSKPPKSRRKAAVPSPRSRKGTAQPNAEEESGSSSASVRPPPGAGGRKWGCACGWGGSGPDW